MLLAIFFVTSADSAVLVLASMSTDEAGDPPPVRRVVWGVAVALIAAAMLLAGGLDALQALITIVALPFALLLCLVMFSLYRVLDAEDERLRLQARRERQRIDAWIRQEMSHRRRRGADDQRRR